MSRARYFFHLLLSEADTLLFFVPIALLYYLALPIGVEKKIAIPKGCGKECVVQTLEKNGIAVGVADRLILRYLSSPHYGDLNLSPALSRADLLYRAMHAKIPIFRVTLIPGETTPLFLDQVAKKLDVNRSKLSRFYRKHAALSEGFLVPDTYLLPKGMDEERLILFLLKYSNKRLKRLSRTTAPDSNQSDYKRILTIASIIQKEAADAAEMPLIASVIYNRLKKGMRLQMDGTLNYGRYSHVKVTPQRIRDDNSSYNTYKHKGLPDLPVATVSDAAIDAALHPAKSNYLYFVRNRRTGKHDFSTTFKAHRRKIKRK